jgi:outer membrane protein OmpA-like peptidoglycan-associated protein
MGLSLLDFGKINYRDNSNTYHLETDNPAYYLNWSTDEFASNTDLDTSFSNIFYGSPSASLREDNFDMALPTALSFQVDWNIKKRFYVNASYIHGFNHDKPGLDRPSVIALTPRYESPIFEASIPMSYLDYTGKIARIGIALRFASFFVGSDRLGSLFGLTDLYGMDFYTGLKFSMIKEKIPDADGDKVSDKKDKCPDVAGLLKFEGCPDRDGDDVPDATDQCPDIKGVPALAGCPDRDNDGIIDSKDECPDTPGVALFNGCPDSDNDGLRDSEDDCPSVAGLIIYKGCPDTDGDSIPDPKDDCPTAKGLAVYNGCPDSDNDGLPDPKDECPYDVGPVSNKGCPVKILQAPTPKAPTQVQLTPEEQEIINKVFSNLQFEIGKAIIKSSSYESLDDLAELMKKKPSFKLKIDGHTDNTGSAALNKTLSLKRAQAAKTYLVNKGVETERITAKGYGKDKPVATNSTAEGRAKNRRVEFLIVE